MADNDSDECLPNSNLYLAENLRRVVEEFVTTFEDCGAASTLEDLIQSKATPFVGGSVRKQPERFTREELIEPCFTTLGYEVNGDPVTPIKEDRKQPDVELNDGSSEYICIAECKALNRERRDGAASENLKERYLEQNAFATHKFTPDLQYLVGIATDGFTWQFYAKDLTANEHRNLGNSSLLPVIRQVYNDRYGGSSANSWPDMRDHIANDFVSNFAADKVLEQCQHSFN